LGFREIAVWFCPGFFVEVWLKSNNQKIKIKLHPKMPIILQETRQGRGGSYFLALFVVPSNLTYTVPKNKTHDLLEQHERDSMRARERCLLIRGENNRP
jgi:hypothetical protein